MQRLWAGVHLHRCRSGVLSGARLLNPETVQALPDGKEERSRGIRLPVSPGARNARHLLGLRSAHHRSLRTPRRSSCLLPGLLRGAQRERRRTTRTLRARRSISLVSRARLAGWAVWKTLVERAVAFPGSWRTVRLFACLAAFLLPSPTSNRTQLCRSPAPAPECSPWESLAGSGSPRAWTVADHARTLDLIAALM